MRQTLFSMLISLLVATAASQAQQHTLSGQVLDTDNHPIPHVRIEVIRGSKAIPGESKADGTYAIKFSDGQTIGSVQYELTGWNPAVISGLSGARDHRITKTMYQAGSGLTPYQAQEVFASLQTIYQQNEQTRQSQDDI